MRIAKMNDWHVPFEDKRAIKVAMNFLEELEPDMLILDEVVDFYAISKFSKDPLRRLGIQKELDQAQDWLWKLKNRFPKLTIKMVESNHDKRLGKYLNSQAPELAYLRCLDFKHLLGLDGLNIAYLPYYQHRKILFKHGEVVRKDSAMTARSEWLKEGMSGASGHSHRLGQFFKRVRGGSYSWTECGCLCDLNPDYVDGTADWMLGLGAFFFEDKGTRYDPKVFPIINYEIMWGHKIIGE